MKRKKLQDALDQVSDKYIAEAAQKPKRQKTLLLWLTTLVLPRRAPKMNKKRS